jgi:hypothetical protein
MEDEKDDDMMEEEKDDDKGDAMESPKSGALRADQKWPFALTTLAALALTCKH